MPTTTPYLGLSKPDTGQTDWESQYYDDMDLLDAKIQAMDLLISSGGQMPSQPYHVVSTASENTDNIKSAPGFVTGWSIFNNSGGVLYVKLYNRNT